MKELCNLIARQEMRCEQLIIHLRETSNAAEAEVVRMYVLSILEELVRLKGERQRLEDELEFELAA